MKRLRRPLAGYRFWRLGSHFSLLLFAPSILNLFLSVRETESSDLVLRLQGRLQLRRQRVSVLIHKLVEFDAAFFQQPV